MNDYVDNLIFNSYELKNNPIIWSSIWQIFDFFSISIVF